MRVLWAVHHGLAATSKKMGAELGVTGPQRLVIRIVGRSPGISAGELAEILHVHPSTLTGILSRLVERGLIQRKSDTADARRALFSLTAKGRRIDSIQSGTVEAKVRASLASVQEDKVQAAREVLSTLASRLEDAAI